MNTFRYVQASIELKFEVQKVLESYPNLINHDRMQNLVSRMDQAFEDDKEVSHE